MIKKTMNMKSIQEELIKAARLIRDFCDQKDSCEGCPLAKKEYIRGCTTWECSLREPAPCWWEVDDEQK